MKTDIKIKTVSGDLPVDIDGDGRFSSNLEGTSIYADTLQALTEKVRDLSKKMVKMEIPGTVIRYGRWDTGDPKFADIIVTGIHSANNNLMVKDDKGKTYQFTYYGDHCYVRLTVERQEEYLRLRKAKLDAEAAFDKFEKSIRMPEDRDALLKLWEPIKAKKGK